MRPKDQWDAMADREALIPLNESPPLLVVEAVSPFTIETDYRTKYAEYAVLYQIPKLMLQIPPTRPPAPNSGGVQSQSGFPVPPVLGVRGRDVSYSLIDLVLDIPEYWIVDPIELQVTVCTLKGGARSVVSKG
jgi:Uma2 family endonuclease